MKTCVALRATALSMAFVSIVTVNPSCTHAQSAKSSNAELVSQKDHEFGRWKDLGTLATDDPVKLSLTETHVYALSGQTLYGRTPGEGEGSRWQEIETFEYELNDIYSVSGSPDTIILTLKDAFETLPLRISHDGGKSWAEYGSEFTDQPEKIGVEYQVPKQFFREDSGKLYASLSGLNTVVSTDLGRTWSYALGKQAEGTCPGGESRTITLPAHPGIIFKSQDCPLKDSTVASVNTAPTEQKLEKLIDESFLGQKTPKTLAASAALPDTLFVGVDDGIVRYDVKEKKSDWLMRASTDQEWSGYLTQIWVDPLKSDHIVVSGYPRDSKLEFLLFESKDGGKNFESLRSPNDPKGLAQSSGSATFGNHLVISAREEENKPRIWLFDLTSSSVQ
ncbi:MAG: hypothetical protein EOP10_01180 [Proteobacteria bacterium]|nr:MAG: hypothetical protein EOP10_01180 [Pseudomonadota bacterium]